MRLTPAQARQIWARFSNSPLFAQWPAAFERLDTLLEPIGVPSDGIIYEPGDTPAYLYLITEGSVEQRVQAKGQQPWLIQRLGPGEFFGQSGLFTNQYRSQAVASPGTILYRMSAAALRMALDQNPALQEQLLHEKRAGRLRRIPLFRSLSDGQLRWLAQVIQERDVAPEARLPLKTEAGLWIVDYGQAQVTGAANPHADWPTWGITAGNFFFSPSAELKFGRNCIANTADAAVASRLFFLPVADANRLIAAFPDMGNIVAQPIDIAALLATTELLGPLTQRQQQHLAQFAAWEFVPAGQNVTTQGTLGHSYVYIRDGAAIVTAVDERGRQRPRNYLTEGEAYGTTSVLEGRPRDATVRAVKAPDARNKSGLDGAEVIILHRDDVQYAFATDRQLWRRGVPLVDQTVKIKQDKSPFDWMDQGETLRWRKQPHVLWLIMPEAFVVLGGLMLLALVAFIPSDLRKTAGIAAAICGGPALIVIAFVVLLNYWDDYYALTNRRITRRDRQLILYQARMEAPLEMVQDVTVSTHFWGRLFGFGDVTVRTASKDRAITLSHIPDPEEVRADILAGRIEAQAAGHGKQSEVLRSSLIANLQLALPISERQRALGNSAEPPQSLSRKLFAPNPQPPQPSQERLPGTPRGQPAWLVALSKKLPDRWSRVLVDPAKAAPKALSGQVVWRKHWINLLIRVSLPLLTFLLVLALGFGLLFTPISGISTTGLVLPWLVILAASGFWLWWRYADWHNDIYVLTDEKIIDIEMKPLGIDSKRREGSLERVQNVDAKQRGLISVIFDYGDVVISTAAGDEGYTFLMVPHPKKVQTMVFQKLDVLRRRQEEQKTQQRQRELIEGLQIYHQIQTEQASRGRSDY